MVSFQTLYTQKTNKIRIVFSKIPEYDYCDTFFPLEWPCFGTLSASKKNVMAFPPFSTTLYIHVNRVELNTATSNFLYLSNLARSSIFPAVNKAKGKMHLYRQKKPYPNRLSIFNHVPFLHDASPFNFLEKIVGMHKERKI